MPNVELIQRVLDHITVHPEQWDQRSWSTCFAGHTLRLCGEPIDRRPSISDLRTHADRLDYMLNFTVLGEHVADRAMRLLGIDFAQAMRMFSEHNTLADLYNLANEFTNGAIEVPAEIALGTANVNAIQEALSQAGNSPVMVIFDEVFEFEGTRVTSAA